MVKNRILLYIIIDNSFCIFTKKKKTNCLIIIKSFTDRLYTMITYDYLGMR